MAQQLLQDFETLQKTARPIGIGHNRPPAGVPKAIIGVFVASFAVLLLALSAPAMGSAPFPLIFAIFAVCFVGFFIPFLRTRVFKEATERRHNDDVATGSGILTAREAAWQILPLPIALAAFGMFTIAAKAVLFA
ncbi:MAG: hypothetical protein V2J26_05840 [Pacificimonas sp.]|nr:hypothetical protein [Pacificimonas sp.]